MEKSSFVPKLNFEIHCLLATILKDNNGDIEECHSKIMRSIIEFSQSVYGQCKLRESKPRLQKSNDKEKRSSITDTSSNIFGVEQNLNSKSIKRPVENNPMVTSSPLGKALVMKPINPYPKPFPLPFSKSHSQDPNMNDKMCYPLLLFNPSNQIQTITPNPVILPNSAQTMPTLTNPMPLISTLYPDTAGNPLQRIRNFAPKGPDIDSNLLKTTIPNNDLKKLIPAKSILMTQLQAQPTSSSSILATKSHSINHVPSSSLPINNPAVKNSQGSNSLLNLSTTATSNGLVSNDPKLNFVPPVDSNNNGGASILSSHKTPRFTKVPILGRKKNVRKS